MLLMPRDGSFRKLLVLLTLLLEPGPGFAWYKHVADRRYHTVGRASGLLMGVRRSPYMWRREEDQGEPGQALKWDYHQKESPGESEKEGGGDGGTLDTGGKVQATYTKPTIQKSDFTRGIQSLTSNEAAERVAPNGVQQRAPQRYTGKKDQISRGMQDLFLSQYPEAASSIIRSSLGRPKPEKAGVEDYIPPYNKLLPQEAVSRKAMLNHLILTLYNKWAPKDALDKKTFRQYVQVAFNKQTPETDTARTVETFYHDISNPENAMVGGANTLKRYIFTLYNKRVPEEVGMSADTEALKQYVPASYSKRTSEEINKGPDLGMPYNKRAPSEPGIDSDLKTPTIWWVSTEMERSKNGPLRMQTQEHNTHLLIPHAKRSALKIGVDGGMHTIDGTNMDRYVPSSYPTGTLEGTGMEKLQAYHTHRWPQEEAGNRKDTQSPFDSTRKA